ncbi:MULTISPECIES: PAS domain-containing protein [unclassified Methylobacterium]|uniref:PAS domain-containing protein n=1 Tax=unclassified Methylobacterium TaxID=2615210 RepID=UPI0011C1F18A|nr:MULTISPECIES: PAS domain-containing protein [unclassified Methylobacterium]QEE37725.1 diguanylate cyclase [Methylobacterium sp. WL1]TXN02920.1 PAS domain-containing protein [Methylobacterium sp. WL64]TXN56654.1 PAS domain-containing protein [Methylobacterium sp. WL2]
MGLDARARRKDTDIVARALAASNVGTWEWRIADDVVRCDSVAATMLGIPRSATGHGTTYALFFERVHPQDRQRVGAIVKNLQRHGGLYVAQYRTVLTPDDVRWVLARGRFVVSADGIVSEARGIVIDVTESSRDGFLDESAFCAIDAPGSGIDRVAELALALFNVAEGLGESDFVRLKPLMDALLHEIGRQLVESPAVPAADSVH